MRDTGANRYVLRFPSKAQLPPVNGFWSLTMYDAQYGSWKPPVVKVIR